jgi:branched-chain amino acid aminotransferase
MVGCVRLISKIYTPVCLSKLPAMSETWCNTRWLPTDNYPGTARDRGACLGLGLFETLLAIDGVPIFADRHLARLRLSCERLGWSFDFPDFSAVVAELVVRNDLTTGRVRLRLVVTGGSGSFDDLSAGVDRMVWLSAFPAVELPESVTLCRSPWPRNERSPLAGLKTACYAENLIALDHARQRGFQETVVLNSVGDLCETAMANLFLVKNEVILTPSLDSGCLPGIGREVVCEIALAHGIRCEQRRLTMLDLDAADEIFLTSSTRGPTPVSRFEDRNLPHGAVSAILRKLWRVEIGDKS